MTTAGTIFFDYDGTLHDTMRIYGPALRKAYAWLVEEGYCQPQEFTDDWISHWLGWTTEDMWTTFQPDLPEEVWREAAHRVGQEMSRLSEEGHSQLFGGMVEALQRLKDQGYVLCLLSNCGWKYRDNHRRWHGLDRWFSHYYVAEDYPDLPKWRIYEIACEKDQLPEPRVMVGDRFHDLEVGYKAQIPTIGCIFGYPEKDELKDATVLIESPYELVTAIEEVLS